MFKMLFDSHRSPLNCFHEESRILIDIFFRFLKANRNAYGIYCSCGIDSEFTLECKFYFAVLALNLSVCKKLFHLFSAGKIKHSL